MRQWPAPRSSPAAACELRRHSVGDLHLPEALRGKSEENQGGRHRLQGRQVSFTANARAKTIAATDGLVGLADKTDKVLGCAIVGPKPTT